MLSRRRERKGFTLIELMIVVAIIGILAAIAIPQFAKMREKGYDADAQSALANIKTAQEAYFIDWNAYTNDPDEITEWFDKGDDITVTLTTPEVDGVTGNVWTGTTKHRLSANTWEYDSRTGKIQKQGEGDDDD